MVEGEANGMYASYYSDDLIRQKGVLENGFVKGLWEYNLRIEKDLKNALAGQVHATGISYDAISDKILSYTINYTHRNPEENEFCPIGKCIESKLSGEVK